MRIAITALAVAAVSLAGCASDGSHHGHDHHDSAKVAKHESQMKAINAAIAVLHPTEGNKAAGTVTFTEAAGKVKVVAHVTGLTPNQKHAIHVHEFGDCSAPDAISAGGHYNPEGHDHGLPDGDKRHAGDFGNLQADASGVAHYEFTVDNISVAGLKNPIIGRSVIVHANPDDGGQPVGNAGPRIACGVIGVKNPK